MEATINEIIENWINGNLTDALDALEAQHVSIAAMVVHQMMSDSTISRREVNSLVRCLTGRESTRQINRKARHNP